MTNKTILITVFAIISLIFMNSCEKDKGLLETNLQNTKRIKSSSFLEFANSEEFKNAVNDERNGTHTTTFKKPKDFISMLDVYELIELTENNEERNFLINKYQDILIKDKEGKLDIIVVDPILASFLSTEGLVKVGNEICLVEKNKIKKITNGDVSKIKLLKQAIKDLPEDSITVEKFIQIQTHEKAYWNGTQYYSNSQRCVDWEKWASYGPYGTSSVGGKIKSYKKSWWGWNFHRVPLDIRVKWDAIYWYWNNESNWATLSENGNIHNSKSKGYLLSVSQSAGGSYTPNPVIGLQIKFTVNGNDFGWR